MVKKKKSGLKIKSKNIKVIAGSGLGILAVTLLVVAFGIFDLPTNETTLTISDLEDGDILPTGPPITTITSNSSEPITTIPQNVTIAETKDPFQNFLEVIGFQSIDQFGVGTFVTLKDIQGNEKTSSSILAVPLLSLETPEGFFPSELNVRFFGVLKDQEAVSLNLEGTVDFLIDQQVIETKKLFQSSSIIDANQIELFVVDSIPAPFDQRVLEFNYQFDEETIDPTPALLLQFPEGSIFSCPVKTNVLVEEQSIIIAIAELKATKLVVSPDIGGMFTRCIGDLNILLSELQGAPITEHTFRIIIKDLIGTYQAAGKDNIINWSGEFIAYELDFTIDKRLITIINEDQQVVSVLKNDGRLLVSGSSSKTTTSTVSGTFPFTCTKSTPEIGILFNVEVFENLNNFTGIKIGEVLATNDITIQTIEGLQRNGKYIVRVQGQEFLIDTPMTQKDYSIIFSIAGGQALIRSIDGGQFRDGTFKGWECVQKNSWDAATSNFGYSYDSRDIP